MSANPENFPEKRGTMSDTTDELLAERQKSYGDPIITHIRIAQVWSGILGHEVSAHDVALCMQGLKLVRAQIDPDHEDNMRDVHGYARIAERIMDDDVAHHITVAERQRLEREADEAAQSTESAGFFLGWCPSCGASQRNPALPTCKKKTWHDISSSVE